MGSPFEAAMAVADIALDATFGESILIQPMAKAGPNARARPDPDRPSAVIIAGWTDPKAIVRPTNSTGHPDSESMRFSDDKPSIDFPTAALPYELRIGDAVTRLKTGETFGAETPVSNGFTRTSTTLTARRGRS